MGPIRTWRGAVPKEFVCPMAGKFMSDPVILPAGRGTCDRSSITATWLADDAQPNLVLRTKICAWISQHITRHFEYRLDPPFAFISTESHLRAAFESLKQFATADEALPFLVRLSKAIRRLDPALLSRGGFTILQCVGDVLAKPDLPHPWVFHAVSIFATAGQIEIKANVSDKYGECQLDNIGSRIHRCRIPSFQVGFVNLMHTLALANEAELGARVGQSYGIIKTLVSYLWPMRCSHVAEGIYQKVPDTLFQLAAAEGNAERMARAGAVVRILYLFEWSEGLEGYDPFLFDAVLRSRGRVAAMERSMQILHRLCGNSEVACARMVSMAARRRQLYTFCDVLFNRLELADAVAAGLGVLAYFLQYCELAPMVELVELRLLQWIAGPRGAARYGGTIVNPAVSTCLEKIGEIRLKQRKKFIAELDFDDSQLLLSRRQ